MSELDTPTDLRYTAEHEWVKRTGPTSVRVGITDFAQSQLGDVVFVQLPAAGEDVTAGESLGEVESTKSVSDIFAPFTAKVIAANGGGGWRSRTREHRSVQQRLARRSRGCRRSHFGQCDFGDFGRCGIHRLTSSWGLSADLPSRGQSRCTQGCAQGTVVGYACAKSGCRSYL